MKSIISISAIVVVIVLLFQLSCKKEYSCENCIGSNKPPVANAGKDTSIILPVDSVLLNGGASSDPDDGISSYAWKKITGSDTFNIVQSLNVTTIVNGLVKDIYLFELTVTDKSGLSAKDTVQVTVYPAGTTNRPPVANAGADTTIVLPVNSVRLDGSNSSDPDNNISAYEWKKISGPGGFNISSPNNVQAQVMDLEMGVYLFELKVTDADGLFSLDTVQVTVNAAVSTNIPPVAMAGNDTTIQGNQASCLTSALISLPLNGSSSYDPDGTIVSYLWSGANGIANPGSATTTVNITQPGTYNFILKATDNRGAFGYDTVKITVNIIIEPNNRPVVPAQLVPVATIPQARGGVTLATAGNKLFIAGGITKYSGNQPADFSSRVDIYDITTGQWSVTQLSEPCIVDAVAVLGNKIFFAEGLNIDIYDISANAWSTAQLSQARGGIAGGSINGKVFFAGGNYYVPIDSFYNTSQTSNRVDIFDEATNSWSTKALHSDRYDIFVTTVGSKIFFTGGNCSVINDCRINNIDIYDAATNKWSNEIYVPKDPNWVLFSGIAAGNKNYWITGEYWEGGSLVEIRDEITHTTTYECLSGTLYNSPVRKGDKLIFPVSTFSQSTANFKLTHFDIYDLSTNTWSISKLPQPVINIHSFISVNNEVYAIVGNPSTGGILYDKLFKLEF